MAARLTTFVVVAIVAVTLIAGLIVGAQRDDSDGPVDLIVHNARVYTADRPGLDGRSRRDSRQPDPACRQRSRDPAPEAAPDRDVDAKGAAVLPGFNDAHRRLLRRRRRDSIASTCSDAAAIEDVERRIRDWAEANPDRPWVLGRGWHRDVFADDLPTRQMLDRLVPDRPALLLSADGHTAWVNSKALRLAKIGRRHREPGARRHRRARPGPASRQAS